MCDKNVTKHSEYFIYIRKVCCEESKDFLKKILPQSVYVQTAVPYLHAYRTGREQNDQKTYMEA
jgi:hypothetical protein